MSSLNNEVTESNVVKMGRPAQILKAKEALMSEYTKADLLELQTDIPANARESASAKKIDIASAIANYLV